MKSLLLSPVLVLAWALLMPLPLYAQQGGGDKLAELQSEIRQMQRDTIDLQKLIMQSGVSPALGEQLKQLQEKVASLEKAAAEKGPESSEGIKQQLALLQEQVSRLKVAAPAPGAPVVETGKVDLAALMTTSTAQTLAINLMWTLLCGFLVMFMQAGFAAVETGFTRAKNAAHTMSMNFMIYALAMLGYWFCGFAIQMGGTAAASSAGAVATLGPDIALHLNKALTIDIFGKTFQLAGLSGFCLPPDMLSGSIFTLFLFQMVFMDTTATVPTGAMAERWKFLPFVVYGLIVGGLIYPIYASWVWGGGWLAGLGKMFGLGHGHVDFAGSSVVHLCGGTLALVGSWILGPRVGKYNADGSANPIPGHNIPMGVIGTFILAFGWFGFNAGSTLSGMDVQIGVIATNTMLASAAGALTGMITTWIRFSKPDPSFMCNGMLAGLVAITAPCAFVDSWAAVAIGLVSGVLVVFAAYVVEEKLKIDDPVGAVAVHGFNGAWGVLALGLFANGKYGAGWNGVDGNVAGLFYGDGGQFVAQLVGTITCVVAVGAMGYLAFMSLEKLLGNRATDAQQIEGMDLSEMSSEAYPPDLVRSLPSARPAVTPKAILPPPGRI